MFEILSHTADVALRVSAPDLPRLFAEAARGWKQLVLEDTPVQPLTRRTIRLEGVDREDLLVQWLSELNFLLNARRWIAAETTELKIEPDGKSWRLTALVRGEALDPQRHHLAMEIKAVTFHQLQITRKEDGYHTRIVFDI